MNSKTAKVCLIAAVTAGLGAAGYHLVTLSRTNANREVKPIPLNMDLGPIGLLGEPAGSPYELFTDKAVQAAPVRDAAEREQLVSRLRALRDEWRSGQRVASFPVSAKKPNAPDRL